MPPPLKTLTPQEFKALRPQGHYSGYLRYIAKRRGLPKHQISDRPPMLTTESLLRGIQIETPAQLQARANQMAATQSKAQLGIINSGYAQQRAEALRDMQAQAAAGRAAAQMNAGLLGQVGGEYNAAARELTSLGGGLTGGAAAATAADVGAANVGLGAVGAPGVTAQGGPTQAGVEQFRNVTLPAGNLGTQGGIASFGIAGLINSQNLRATQEAQAGMIETNRQIASARTAALKELAAGRPAQAGEFLMKLQEARNQQIALAQSLLQFRGAAGQQQWERGVTTKEQARADKALALQQQQETRAAAAQTFSQSQALHTAALQNRAVDVQRSIATGFWVDATGKAITNPKTGKPLKVPAAMVAAGTTKASAIDTWEDIRYDVERSTYNQVKNATSGGGTAPRQAVLNALLALYPPRFHAKIRAYIKALPGAAFTRAATSSGSIFSPAPGTTPANRVK